MARFAFTDVEGCFEATGTDTALDSDTENTGFARWLRRFDGSIAGLRTRSTFYYLFGDRENRKKGDKMVCGYWKLHCVSISETEGILFSQAQNRTKRRAAKNKYIRTYWES